MPLNCLERNLNHKFFDPLKKLLFCCSFEWSVSFCHFLFLSIPTNYNYNYNYCFQMINVFLSLFNFLFNETIKIQAKEEEKAE